MNTEREGGTEMQQRERQTESKREREREKHAAQNRKNMRQNERGGTDAAHGWRKQVQQKGGVLFVRLWQADKQST